MSCRSALVNLFIMMFYREVLACKSRKKLEGVIRRIRPFGFYPCFFFTTTLIRFCFHSSILCPFAFAFSPFISFIFPGSCISAPPVSVIGSFHLFQFASTHMGGSNSRMPCGVHGLDISPPSCHTHLQFLGIIPSSLSESTLGVL